MRCLKLFIEYDGTAYQGWQSQKSGRTIQDIISSEIRGITGEVVRLTAASRTDAGVHALGQVAAFGTSSDLLPQTVKRALNARLPSDIRIVGAEETTGTFHPRYDAIGKRYFYLMRLDRGESAFFYKFAWHVRASLDIEEMRRAAEQLIGEHDFSSFRGSGCSAQTTVRSVREIQISLSDTIDFMTASVSGSYLKIAIEANAFLRHMVRNIVGTLVEVGKARIPSGEIRDILSARDRTKGGPTAPAHGLFLEKVIY